VWDEALLASTHLNMLDDEMSARALTWLTQMSLDNRKNDHPQRLSYGEKRRLNILSILLHQPTLLLMDEFLIGQDLANALAWMSFFRSYCDQGHTVLFVTHHAGLAQQFCDRMIYLSEGSVIVDAPVGKAFETIKLFDRPGNLQVMEGRYHPA
jgi:energy-coupling factor transport system ATP-binding protein